MPSLILFRHGKSDWDADYGDDDRMRPLSERGRRSARTMGRFLGRARQVPDAALTSPAVRAESTLALAMKAGRWSCPVRKRDALYGDVSGLLAEVRREAPATALLLVVGHDPAWSEAASLLTGGTGLRLVTGALARIDLTVDRWADVGAATGHLVWLVGPRLFPRKGFDFAD
jgi:phosphohistidine phosphatase